MPGYSLQKSSRLGEILQEMAQLTRADLEEALAEQVYTRKSLGAILIERGLVDEETVAKAISKQINIPYLDDPKGAVQPEVLRYIPESLARRAVAVPIKLDDMGLTVAMADPLDLVQVDDIGYVSNCRIQPVVATKESILAAIDGIYGVVASIEQLVVGIELNQVEVIGEQAQDARKTERPEIDAPIVKLVNLLFVEAVRQHASDVHIEPMEKFMRVRFRVDGLLREIMSPPKTVQDAVCSRIKIMSGLDIAERRMPQDGRAFIRTRDGTQIDVRVNTVPTLYGEKIGIRLLAKDVSGLDLRNAGMAERLLADFLDLIHRPNGMVLVVGPTGNGKTTALYSALKELNQTTQHIMTIEDPVEYRLENVNQIQVNAKAGLTFAEGLRAILRQDPNILLVGEIRDRETAEIAIEAAMTGHLVFSTVHSTDAAHTIARLKTLGIDPHIASAALAGIVSTRLVRRLCQRCRATYKPLAEMAKQLKLPAGGSLFRPGGCEECRQTGYKGRVGIFELVPMTQALQEIVRSDASVTQIQDALGKIGTRTLWVDGAEKVIAGVTSVDELMRVTRSYMTAGH